MSLDNSKIRKIILVEHEGLRMSLLAINRQLDQVTEGDAKARASVHQQLTELLQSFLRHIEHEERILRPVLKDIDAWGPQRLAAMDEEHQVQRLQVTQLAAINPENDPAGWASEVATFVKDLLVDMAAEEKDCLSPNVLRDDVVVVDCDSE